MIHQLQYTYTEVIGLGPEGGLESPSLVDEKGFLKLQ